MSEPIVFISKQRIKEGKLDVFKERYREVAEYIRSSRPGTVAYLGYLDEDGREASLFHLFPDADAMAAHIQGAGERANEAAEFMETKRFEIYGQLPEELLEGMKQASSGGIELIVNPQRVGGYLRPQSE
jgi:hypothetical protein